MYVLSIIYAIRMYFRAYDNGRIQDIFLIFTVISGQLLM